jgi:hypothetical protein
VSTVNGNIGCVFTRQRCSTAVAVLMSALFASSRADASDVLASPCEDSPFHCERAPLTFDRTDALPVQFDFDTGWVPKNSNLQVRIHAAVDAQTRVHLSGSLDTSWPEALTLTTPGNANGAAISFQYGLETSAQAKLDISVLGKSYSWTGDLPYVPMIDFTVKGNDGFDAWGFAPGHTLTSQSPTKKLASIGLDSIIGSSIPGLDGGFELDAAVDLSATYVTDRIVLARASGPEVEGGPIAYDGDESPMSYASGSSVEIDVHPEGTVTYDGVLHLIPTFYVSLLGKDWSIPVADVPVPFAITKTPWVFEPERVHVPLPALVIENTDIDLGTVAVGQEALGVWTAKNDGEAAIKLVVSSSDPDSFAPIDFEKEIEHGGVLVSAVRFSPHTAGEFAATITLASNDPDAPKQTFTVHGVGVDGATLAGGDGVDQGSGCGCRTAPASSEAPRGALGLAIALILARRAARRGDRVRLRRSRG